MSVEAMEKTLGKVADVLQSCGNFYTHDWCNDHCPLWNECDKIISSQNISKVVK